MTVPAPRPPAGRYGPEPTGAGRRLQRVGLALLVAAAMVVVAWVGRGALTDPVQWRDVGFSVDSPTSVQVTFEVTTRDGAPATCRVHALSQSYAQVGVLDVDVPSSPSSTRRVTVTLPTLEQAVTGTVDTCEPRD